MTAVGVVLCLLGSLLLVIAAWGVVRLPDALSRQHAATKAGTLALSVFALGAGLIMPQPGWIARLIALVALSMITLPLASHALARAAVREMESGSESDSSGPA